MSLAPDTRCEYSVSARDRWPSHQCTKKAYALGKYWDKEVPLCRMHHPDDVERRRKARGPTQWEIDMDAWQHTRERAALVPALAEALEAVRAHGTMFDIFRGEFGQTVLKQVKTALAKVKQAGG